MTSRTNNSNFFTLFIVPLDLARGGKLNGVTDTPSFRTVVEGADVRNMRADQILIHRDCDRQSNEYKPWFDALSLRLVVGGQLTVI